MNAIRQNSSETALKKILIFGAGVLGSLYAARLKQAGLDVTLLARNPRLADIKKHGIVLEHAQTGKGEVVAVPVIEHLRENESENENENDSDTYDLIVVLVRKNQLAGVLPLLAAHKTSPNILFMVNNPSGYVDWANAVGRERLVLGFAGAGGTLVGNVVRYVVVSRLLQPTTFGELDGSRSARIEEISRVFRAAGFPTALTSNMDAWQKTHVAWISPLANALYRVHCDNHLLARSPDVVRMAVRAVREGFSVLRALGIPITPAKLRLWEWIPESVLVRSLMLWADTNHFKTAAVEHTAAAADEMHQIAEEFRTLAASTSIATPAIDELRAFIPRPEENDANVEVVKKLQLKISHAFPEKSTHQNGVQATILGVGRGQYSLKRNLGACTMVFLQPR